MATDEVAQRLWWTDENPSTWVVSSTRDGRRRASATDHDDRPRLRDPLVRFELTDGRIAASLLLLDGERSVDATFQPGAVVEVLRSGAKRARVDANAWLGAVARRLVASTSTDARWQPSEWLWADLPAVLAGLTHPMLGPAIEAGAVPAAEVPRWAAPALRSEDVRSAARSLFGDTTTRPVVRSLGALLAPEDPATFDPWWRMAVASAMADHSEPDQIASVLAMDVDEGVRPNGLPSRDDLEIVRRGTHELGSVTIRIALDALGRPRGISRLLEALRLAASNEVEVGWPPPRRLEQLEACCLSQVVIDPRPEPPPQPRRPVVVPDRPARAARPARPEPAVAAWQRPHIAPNIVGATGTDGFVYPPDIAAIHHLNVGRLTLELPRSAAELRAWGQILQNCLADYGPAVTAGRSIIIGVRDDSLVAALEVDRRQRRLRQFVGVRNRTAPSSMTRPVTRLLFERAVLARPGAG